MRSIGWMLALGLLLCPGLEAAGAGKKGSKPKNSCRAALRAEARLLSKCIRQTVPDSELALGLDEFAANPVVTRETVEKFGEVRTMVHMTAPQTMQKKLQGAKRRVEKQCKTIDSREQRAQNAVDEAIGMLSERKYRETIERFTHPGKLKEMKASAEFEKAVARFEAGHGEVLLEKLKGVRKGPPVVKRNGSIWFVSSATLSAGQMPVIMIEIDKRWYFGE